MPTSDRGPRLHRVPVNDGEVSVYAGTRVGRAMDEITEDMTVYKGVRLAEVLDAVYQQGRKDGRRDIVEAFDDRIVKDKELKHRNPGRAKKAPAKKAAAKKATGK